MILRWGGRPSGSWWGLALIFPQQSLLRPSDPCGKDWDGGGGLEKPLWGILGRNKRIAILSLLEIHKGFHQICN